MRTFSLILVFLLWAGAVAQQESAQLPPGALGTRTGSPANLATPSGSSTGWWQVTLALVVVAVALRYGLPKLLRWAGKTGDGSPLDGQVRVIETRAVPNGSLMLVKARDRLLLIGSSPQGMQLLADLTPANEQSSLSGMGEHLYNAHTNPGKVPSFAHILRQAQPMSPPVELQESVVERLQLRLQETQRRLAKTAGSDLREGRR